MSAASASQPQEASEPGGAVRWIGLRLGLLIVAILAIDVAVPIGSQAISVQLAPAGRWLFLFGMGWDSFAPILLALWLAWGGGAIVVRLVLVLGVAALDVGVTVLDGLHGSDDDPFQMFIGGLVLYILVILSVQALMMPLRGYLDWQFWFTRGQEVGSHQRGAKWSLFQIIVFTAFAAFPLAFARLYDQWATNINGESPGWSWLTLVVQTTSLLIAAGAAAFAVFFEQASWRWRLAAVPLAIATVCLCQWGFLSAVQSLEPFWNTFFRSLGAVAAALIDLTLLRLAGVRLWRQVDPVATVRSSAP